MEKNSRIYIAGHETLAGASFLYRLEQLGYHNLVYRSKEELDLRNANDVQAFFSGDDIDYVFLAAEIEDDPSNPAEVIEGNIAIQTNVLENAYRYGVFHLINVCRKDIYPTDVQGPLKEAYLLSDYLEHVHNPYAVAKIAGIKMCQEYNEQYGTNYITVIPAMLFGEPERSAQLKSTITTYMEYVHHAKTNEIDTIKVNVTNEKTEQYVYCNDFADVCIELMKTNSQYDIVNIGNEEMVRQVDILRYLVYLLNYRGKIVITKNDKNDQYLRKKLDTTRLTKSGFKLIDSMPADIKKMYEDFLEYKDLKMR
ncbi:MAG: NAD-dependent epimerase/dehydratase family protein [Bacillaceae bacterium]